MKKIFTLALFIFLLSPFAKAVNDTLLYENFDIDPTAAYQLYNTGSDLIWVDLDADQQTDANGQPGNWFWSPSSFGTPDSTGCLFSSSWFSSPAQCLNYLMTPPIPIADATSILSWKSAPRQTPYYLDGYKVLVSTSDNFEASFTDTLFIAAEYTGGASTNGGNFSLYTFSPGFIHGLDSTYVEYDANSDSARQVGDLRPFNVSLAQYVGQTIYIAFLHDSYDDNLIAIDDILVTGNNQVGVAEIQNEKKLSVMPNPASDKIEVNYNLPVTSEIIARIYDMKGMLVKEIQVGMQIKGNQKIFLDVSDLSSGNYNLSLIAGKKVSHADIVVIR
ncbi:MAG: T9SS type A sorting domain-containing protein [Bacteroidota bacterium]